MRLSRPALSLLAYLFVSPAGATGSGVPIAHVPDPDLNAVQVMALWSQIMPDAGTPTGTPNLEIRYVVKAPGVTGQAACTATGLGFVGLAPGTAPVLRAEMRGRAQDRSVTYDASVCTAQPDAAAKEVSITLNGTPAPLYHDPRFYQGKAAPVATVPGPAAFGAKTPGALRAVFLADSGCRGKDEAQAKANPPSDGSGDFRDSRFWQDCAVITPQPSQAATDRSWPLNTHAWKAAGSAPDFVMHGGDYHYFFEENAYWQTSEGQDRLEYWFQEFLLPAQPLLLAAPFAFGRGNHEVCNFGWFGPGYLALLNAGPETLCGARNSAQSGWSLPTWSFTVAPPGGNVPPFTVWMVDASDTKLAQTNDRYAPAAAVGRDKIWVTHYPAVKDEYYSQGGRRHIGDFSNMSAVNQAVSAVCDDASCWPKIILSGHQHLFQHLALEFAGVAVTDAYVAGHGGVRMDFDALPGFQGNENGLRACTSTFSSAADGIQVMGQDRLTAQVQTARAYGFLELERNASTAGPTGPQSGWVITPQWYLSPAPALQSVPFCD